MVSQTDIANRALQRVGAKLISTASSNTVLTDTGNSANQVRACYDILRRAELRRNVWRFAVRRTALRALDTNTKIFVPGAYASGTTYAQNNVVIYSGTIYTSQVAGNVGHQPDINPTYWTQYFGPMTVTMFDDTANPPTTYYAGELVYDPNNADAIYMSILNGNSDTPPTSNWVALSNATVAAPNIIYPVGTGPATQSETRNVFTLPNGFMREAPQGPKEGSISYLGYPSNLMYNDWVFENNYIVTREAQVISFRFVADIADTSMFDPMFVEGLASRVAFEVCEPLTQSDAKLQAIGAEYKQFMGDARLTNGIETGATEPPLDDYLACRI